MSAAHRDPDPPLPPGSPTLGVRRCALQALYELDAARGQEGGASLVGVLADEHEEGRASPHEIDAGTALAQMAWEFRDEADREIAELAREWPPHRQPLVDRNLLRLGWYELRHGGAPARKVVHDAVELAKEFGTADSGKFVNGVLDRIMHGGAEASGAETAP